MNGLLGTAGNLWPVLKNVEVYQMLQNITALAFIYLPVLIAVSASGMFGTNSYLGIVLALILMQADTESHIFTVIIAVKLMAELEKKLHKIVPENIDLFITPLVTLILTGALSWFVLDPVFSIIEEGLLFAARTMICIPVGVGSFLLGLGYAPTVVLGVHHMYSMIEVVMLSDDGLNIWMPPGRGGFIMIKAIFFDVDGTLLSHRTGRISPHTRACIRALRAGGTLVFLSTGRHILELRSLPVGEMAFDGYITLNGQLCLDSSQRQLSGTPLPPQAVQALADLFCADGPPLALVEEERIYINRVTDAVRQAQAEISTPVPEVAPYTGRPVYQATAFCSRKEEPLLRALLPTGCKLARWSEGGVDIIPEAGGKAAGMRRFLTRFGLSRLECMAFGDAENDLDMLAYAGIGVAMGNASEAVKHAADYVTASVDEKGIEQALRHFRLI